MQIKELPCSSPLSFLNGCLGLLHTAVTVKDPKKSTLLLEFIVEWRSLFPSNFAFSTLSKPASGDFEEPSFKGVIQKFLEAHKTEESLSHLATLGGSSFPAMCAFTLDIHWMKAPLVLQQSVNSIAAQWTYVDAFLFNHFASDLRSFVVCQLFFCIITNFKTFSSSRREFEKRFEAENRWIIVQILSVDSVSLRTATIEVYTYVAQVLICRLALL